MKKLIPTTRQGQFLANSVPDNRGRPLSYSADTDNTIADWVRGRTGKGDVISNSELRKHAKEIICKQNPNFTGSASWAQNFLLRHRLSLHPTFLTPNGTKRQKMEPNSTRAVSTVTTPHSVPSLQLISSQIVCEGQSQGNDTPVTLSSSLTGGPLATSSSSSYTTVDDNVSSTLALLAGENIQVESNLAQSQATALALSDLTSDPTLAEILGASHDHSTGNIHTSSFNQGALDTPVSQFTYLNSLGHQLSELVVQNNSSLASTVPSNAIHAVLNPPDVEAVGSGTRPLSYAKETDQALAAWVKKQQEAGYKVTFASLRAYAKKLVSPENPNFNASVGWVTPFLLRHNLDLKVNDRRIRSTRKTTHPRKLHSKGEGNEDIEFSSIEDPSNIDEKEIEIQPLEVIPQLSFNEGHDSISTLEQSHEGMDLSDDAISKANISIDTERSNQSFSKKGKITNRSRHTLADKLEVVRLMKEFNVAGHYVSKLLGVANSTLSGWIKLVGQKGTELEALSTNKKRSNRSGQGRPLTYSKENDEAIAEWFRQQQEMGVPVTAQELTTYATNVIRQENHGFIASVGWRHKFLQRHNLQLVKDKATTAHDDVQSIPLPVQTEEVCTDEYTPEVVEKIYPEEILLQLAEWTRLCVAQGGSLAIQLFCKKAEELILPLDSMFVATLGWAFKFLHKHDIMLDPKPTVLDANRKRSLGLTDTMSPETHKRIRSETMTCDESVEDDLSVLTATGSSSTPQIPSTKTYFGKPARDFNGEEKEEVVRYANATTLQKAAIKYGVAAPTVWRWRMELKLHQPKYTANQKKYIVKYAETNSVKDASSRFGITTKTIQNWKKALQVDGTLSDVEIAAIPPPSIQEMPNENDPLTSPGGNNELMPDEVIPLDNSHFQYIVDGGEVAEGRQVLDSVSSSNNVPSSSLEVSEEIQVQDVGMEYDVISSEGHAAKPRCTQEEKYHILQYALDHSIKEASVKYGVSPGTLYYWKKNHLATRIGGKVTGSSGFKVKSSDGLEESFSTATGANLETTVVNVSVPIDLMNSASSIVQSVTGGQENILDTNILADGSTVPTSSLIQAITQTLASATPEQLQSLQQITSDFNLLQAVTTLLHSQEGPLKNIDTTATQQENSGVISSPTEVLVAFHPTTVNITPDVSTSSATTPPPNEIHLDVSDEMPVTVEEVTISQTTDVAMTTADEEGGGADGTDN